MFNIGLYWEKHGKMFFSETIRPNALIFGMKHDLVNPYQVRSNYAPGAKYGPALGVTSFTLAYTVNPLYSDDVCSKLSLMLK